MVRSHMQNRAREGSSRPKKLRCQQNQTKHKAERAAKPVQAHPNQHHAAAGPAPTTRVEYKAPNGLSFVYQGNQLCVVDEATSTMHVLEDGRTIPTTGLRAQFIWGAHSSYGTAAVGVDGAGQSNNNKASKRSAKGHGSQDRPRSARCRETCFKDMPDAVLQLIAMQLWQHAVSPDSACEAAAAAAMLACTGSRAALIIAHAVWGLLEPSSVKPSIHVWTLGMQQQPQSKTVVASVPCSSREAKAMPKQTKGKQEGCAGARKRSRHAAVQALCILADPLRCPLTPAVVQAIRKHRRGMAVNVLLSQHNLTVNALPCECGIQSAMKNWVRTGRLDGTLLDSSAAAEQILARCDRLAKLRGVQLCHTHSSRHCLGYVWQGQGTAEEAIEAVFKDLADAAVWDYRFTRRSYGF